MGRYPLHYAYALSEEHSRSFVKLLLEMNPKDLEHKVDKVTRVHL